MISKKNRLPGEETSQAIWEEQQEESFEDSPEAPATAPDEAAIEALYRETALRIVVQRNDFLLPNLLDMLTVRRSINRGLCT